MRIRLDRKRSESLVEQAREQIISALHAGLLRRGDRLPSLRSLAASSKLNVKTVMRVYTQLQREGLLAIRGGSGAFLSIHDPGALEPAQALRVAHLLRRHLDEAAGMNLSPETYGALVRSFATRTSLKEGLVAVIECNEEQVHLFSREIARRINVRAQPVLLGRLGESKEAAILRTSSILAITDFHLREGEEIAREYEKPLARLRLRRKFCSGAHGCLPARGSRDDRFRDVLLPCVPPRTGRPGTRALFAGSDPRGRRNRQGGSPACRRAGGFRLPLPSM